MQDELTLFPPQRSAVLLQPLHASLFPSDLVATANVDLNLDHEGGGAGAKRRRSKGNSLSAISELDQDEARVMDRTKGSYIAAVMANATSAWRRASSRRQETSRDASTVSVSADSVVFWPCPAVVQGDDLMSGIEAKINLKGPTNAKLSRRPKAIIFSAYEEDLQVRVRVRVRVRVSVCQCR